MSLGSIVVDDARFPVTAIWFHDGRLVMTAAISGPRRKRDHRSSPIKLYGDDGLQVGTFVDTIGWPRVMKDETLHARLTVLMNSVPRP